MKRVLLIFLVLNELSLFANQDTIVNNHIVNQDSISKSLLNVNDSITYSKENSIVILRDTFKLDDVSSKNISSLPISKQIDQTNTFQSTSLPEIAVGKTNGVIDVSPTGAATYTIPISLPPGINGFVPQIALSYNSQGNIGLAGIGWSINGLSSITRVPATNFHDNRVGNINFDSGDRYALDGQRLILKSGVYGGDGAIYETENYSNIKIISHGTSHYGATYGPNYFEVIYPDGTKSFYGISYESKTILTYAITYSENIKGLRISYNYTNSNNTLIIESIKYGGVGITPAINQINFSYSASLRTEQGYIGGFSFGNSKILTEINVLTDGVGFRNYSLSYDAVPSLKYQRLISLIEYNGDKTESFVPINFTYENSLNSLIYAGKEQFGLSGMNSANCKVLNEDFTGDGKTDFIISPNNPNSSVKDKIYLLLDPDYVIDNSQVVSTVNTGTYLDVFPAKQLDNNNKLLKNSGLIFIKNDGDYKLKFQTYSIVRPLGIYGIKLEDEKVWEGVPSHSYFSECTSEYVVVGDIPRTFLSGDFNGDGLTDLVSVTKPYEQFFDYKVDNDYCVDCCYQSSYTINSAVVNFINLDRRIESNFVLYAGSLLAPNNNNNQLITADFNGDGKTDILQITSGKMYVYGFNDNNNIYKIWETSDNRITTNQDFKPLLGDYNGDGKADIIFPTVLQTFSNSYNFYHTNSQIYAVFLSTGKDFFKTERSMPFGNAKVNPYNGHFKFINYISADINGDNKSDFIRITTDTYNNQIQGQLQVSTFSNIGGENNSNVAMVEAGPFMNTITTSLIHYPIPVFKTGDKPNYNLEFGLLSNNGLHSFKFTKDFKKESVIDQISQQAISYKITYKPLIYNVDNYDELQIYQQDFNQIFPYIDIQNALGLKVVSKIERQNYYSTGIALKQVLSYQGAVTHSNGLGFLGFKKITRSNWYYDEDPNRFYNITITSPIQRGAVIKKFATKYPFINDIIESKNIPELNVLRFTSVVGQEIVTASQSVTLLPGFIANGSNGTFLAKINNPATGIDDGATISDYITRTDYTYKTELLPNKVYKNFTTSVSVKDNLTGTNTLKTFEYDSYLNLVKEQQNFSGQGTTITEITYSNYEGNTSYHIGRPLNKKTTNNAAGDVFTTEEEYTYTDYLPIQIKKKGHGAPFITENLTYDNFGNVLSKAVVTTDGQRTSSKTYDARGRFVVSETDTEGMTTVYTSDQVTGNILSKTNPYNQTESFVYDSWGKLIETTDYLGFKSRISYVRSGTETYILTNDDKGTEAFQIINFIGEKIQNSFKDVTGQWISTSFQYDTYERLRKRSESHFEPGYNAIKQWNITDYDEYGRTISLTSYTGKVTNISYNGLTTTVNDGTKTTTTTKNALGQITSVQDLGGTISYTYDAVGNMKTANYDGVVQQITYDGWGRKIQLTDPSAGTYNYEYNQFGETTKEISPKGTTIYTYQPNTGKLLAKTLTGDNTQMSWTYTYDGSTKLLNSLALTNADGNNTNYTYTYDSNKRPASIVEDNLHARFVKSFTYDDFGRINTETSEAKNKANNKIASKTLQYHYQYGEVLKVTDQVSGLRIHEIQSLNERGQVLTALMGNNLKQNDGYDSYGLPQNFVTQKLVGNPTNLMNLSYTFNVQRALLTNRSNSAFSWNESFAYDSQDRLTNFNDNHGNNSHIYDNKGRITNNSQLGDYTYNNYQQTQLNNLVSTAQTWYQDRALQQITYNAFKSPIEINEEGKERISFQYNAGLQRAHMYYGSTATEKMDRPYRRHYSEDGTMEITEDIQNGTTNFVFYLGGDAYSAPAIWKEIHHSNAQPLDAQLYFLHRDHLGSIVMITDATGNIAEKRQFDAWGNIVKLENGNGVPLTAFVILDRGYTGHEHLLGVSLIHMNGRLYDSKLHRFLQPDNYVQDPYNSQNFNRYGYVYNNPLSHVDPSGEFIHLIVGAVIGGVINWAANGAKFSWKGLAHFGIGALAGAAAAGIGAGVNVAMAGGSFGAGFMGTAAGVSSTGFIAGAATGASAGFTNGFVSGIGNTALNGGNIGESLGAGFKNGFKQGIAGGITGGVFGGIDALTKDVNFFTGKAHLDLSDGYGAHGISEKLTEIQGKHVGKFEGVNVYESSSLNGDAAVTLPGRGITVGKGVFTLNTNPTLMQHEYGHILQVGEVGLIDFYRVIGKESLMSAAMNGKFGHVHQKFWTETWANFLSSNYFGSRYINTGKFPIQDINWVNKLKFFRLF